MVVLSKALAVTLECLQSPAVPQECHGDSMTVLWYCHGSPQPSRGSATKAHDSPWQYDGNHWEILQAHIRAMAVRRIMAV